MAEIVSAPLDTTLSFVRSERVVWRESDGGLLAFDPESLEVHELNESLSTVARLCDGQHRAEDMVAVLARKYGLDVEVGAAEVYRALGILRERGLLTAG